MTKDAKKDSEHGIGEFTLPDVLQVPPLSEFGSPSAIAERFGGVKELLDAMDKMQEYLYAV